ncbi:MAG: NAD(P)-dependent oxidoreductase [Pseudomonadota bacterium]
MPPRPTSASQQKPSRRPLDALLPGRRVLVLGSNGFLGCHGAVLAARHGALVAGIDLVGTEGRGERLRRSLGGTLSEAITWAPEQLEAEMGAWMAQWRPDIVLLTSGATSRSDRPTDWITSIRGNVSPPAAILAAVAALERDARPVLVVPGSQLEYGRIPSPWTERDKAQPANIYGVSKLMATELLLAAVRRELVKGCVLRLPLVFGPGQGPVMLVPEIIVKGLGGIPIPMSSGVQRRRFACVDDVAGMMLATGCRLAEGESLPALLNASASPPIPIAEMARLVAGCLESRPEIQIGRLPHRVDEDLDAWPNSDLADSLDLYPVSDLMTAVRRTVDWYRENRWFLASV